MTTLTEQAVATDSGPVLPLEAVLAVEAMHREELARMGMRLAVYRELLERHGIAAPDDSGRDWLALLAECRHLMATAHEFVVGLGTSKELLRDWQR